MKEFIQEHRSLIAAGVLLAIAGALAQITVLLIYPAFLFYWRSRGRMDEVLISFFFVLVMADRFYTYTGTSWFMFLRYIAILIIFAFTLIDYRKRVAPPSKAFRALIPFLIVSFVGLLSSPAIPSSAARTLSYLIVMWTIFQLVPQVMRKHPGFMKDLSRYGLVMAVLSLGLVMISYDMGWFGNRARGIFKNPNSLGAYAMLFFILNSYLYHAQHILSKREYLISTIILFLCIILTGSRTSLGVSIIFGIFYTFNYARRSFRNAVYYILIPLAGYTLYAVGYETIILQFGLEDQLRLSTIEDLGGRLASWIWAWEHWQEHFWFGRGFQYESLGYETNFSPEFRQINRAFNSTFNGFLGMLMNGGVLGLGTFILFVRAQLLRIQDRKIILPVALMLIVTSFLESWLVGSLNFMTSLFFCFIVVMQQTPPKQLSRQ